MNLASEFQLQQKKSPFLSSWARVSINICKPSHSTSYLKWTPNWAAIRVCLFFHQATSCWEHGAKRYGNRDAKLLNQTSYSLIIPFPHAEIFELRQCSPFNIMIRCQPASAQDSQILVFLHQIFTRKWVPRATSP